MLITELHEFFQCFGNLTAAERIHLDDWRGLPTPATMAMQAILTRFPLLGRDINLIADGVQVLNIYFSLTAVELRFAVRVFSAHCTTSNETAGALYQLEDGVQAGRMLEVAVVACESHVFGAVGALLQNPLVGHVMTRTKHCTFDMR